MNRISRHFLLSFLLVSNFVFAHRDLRIESRKEFWSELFEAIKNAGDADARNAHWSKCVAAAEKWSTNAKEDLNDLSEKHFGREDTEVVSTTNETVSTPASIESNDVNVATNSNNVTDVVVESFWQRNKVKAFAVGASAVVVAGVVTAYKLVTGHSSSSSSDN